jgi:beta-lactamase class A
MNLMSFVLSILISSLCVGCFAQAPVADVSLQRPEREIARLSSSAGGIVGASAIHVESGRRISVNGDARFPMASVYKVPIAIQLLARVDQGEVKLDQKVELKPSDIRPNGTIRSLLSKPGLTLSVRNLLELTLLVGDNSAADLLLRLAGGPQAVTARMKALGVIALPDTAGHIAIAVFVKSSDKDEVERERAIAQIARTVYDFFLFQQPTAQRETQ